MPSPVPTGPLTPFFTTSFRPTREVANRYTSRMYFRTRQEATYMGLFKRKADDEVRLKVTGMHCAHCEMNVSRALSQVPGVKGAEADKDKEMAVVRVEGEVDTDALISAVDEAGYHAEPVG